MSPRAPVGMVVPSIRQGPRKRSRWGCGECESSGMSGEAGDTDVPSQCRGGHSYRNETAPEDLRIKGGDGMWELLHLSI